MVHALVADSGVDINAQTNLIQQAQINGGCILKDFCNRQHLFDFFVRVTAVCTLLFIAFVQNCFAVLFNINDIGVYVCDDGAGGVVFPLCLHLDVQLLRHFGKLYDHLFCIHQSAGSINLLLGQTIDDLKLLFRLCNNRADGNCIFDADQLGTRDACRVSILNDIATGKGVERADRLSQMCCRCGCGQSERSWFGTSGCEHQTVVEDTGNCLIVHFLYSPFFFFCVCAYQTNILLLL